MRDLRSVLRAVDSCALPMRCPPRHLLGILCQAVSRSARFEQTERASGPIPLLFSPSQVCGAAAANVDQSEDLQAVLRRMRDGIERAPGAAESAFHSSDVRRQGFVQGKELLSVLSKAPGAGSADLRFILAHFNYRDVEREGRVTLAEYKQAVGAVTPRIVQGPTGGLSGKWRRVPDAVHPRGMLIVEGATAFDFFDNATLHQIIDILRENKLIDTAPHRIAILDLEFGYSDGASLDMTQQSRIFHAFTCAAAPLKELGGFVLASAKGPSNRYMKLALEAFATAGVPMIGFGSFQTVYSSNELHMRTAAPGGAGAAPAALQVQHGYGPMPAALRVQGCVSTPATMNQTAASPHFDPRSAISAKAPPPDPATARAQGMIYIDPLFSAIIIYSTPKHFRHGCPAVSVVRQQLATALINLTPSTDIEVRSPWAVCCVYACQRCKQKDAVSPPLNQREQSKPPRLTLPDPPRRLLAFVSFAGRHYCCWRGLKHGGGDSQHCRQPQQSALAYRRALGNRWYERPPANYVARAGRI